MAVAVRPFGPVCIAIPKRVVNPRPVVAKAIHGRTDSTSQKKPNQKKKKWKPWDQETDTSEQYDVDYAWYGDELDEDEDEDEAKSLEEYIKAQKRVLKSLLSTLYVEDVAAYRYVNNSITLAVTKGSATGAPCNHAACRTSRTAMHMEICC